MKLATVLKTAAVAVPLSLVLIAPAFAGPWTQCSDPWWMWSGYQLIMEAFFDACG